MKVVSFDPGKKTGWAILDPESSGHLLINFGTTPNKTELIQLLKDLETPNVQLQVVVEDYINRPPKSGGFDHTWDKGYTHRIIGMIEGWCLRNRFKMILQQPSDKPAAFGIIGMQYKKGTQNIHHLDAIAHGFFYLFKNGLAPKEKIIDAMAGNRGSQQGS